MTAPRRIAAIDIGTVTTRLLVADMTAESISEVERSTDITHLGTDLTTTGRLLEAGMGRVRDVIARYASRMDALGVEAHSAVATSASRDASNGEEFLAMLESVGVRPQIIEGEREARLMFSGATFGTDVTDVLLDDIGGGSTELVFGSVDASAPSGCRLDALASVDIGSRRLTELFMSEDPPTISQLDAARTHIREACAPYFDGLGVVPRDVISVAGTATSLAAIHQRLEAYDPAQVHGYRLGVADVAELTVELASMTLESRKHVVGLHPGRASVIVAGALILEVVLELASVDSTLVSEQDILLGIALEAFSSAAFDAGREG